jgi:hypothetical protein
MELREPDSADSFLAAASPLLLADEARHNLIFGICATLVEAPSALADELLQRIGQAVGDKGEGLDRFRRACGTPGHHCDPGGEGAVRFSVAAAARERARARKGQAAARA